VDTDKTRRYVYRLLVLVAAIALIFAGTQAAGVAADALRNLTILNLGLFLADIGGTTLLAAVALVSGVAALVIAPHLGTGGVEFVPDEHWKRLWAHDM